MEFIPGTLDVSWEYTLDGTPVQHRVACTHYIHTLGVVYCSESTYQHVFGRGRKPENPKETHKRKTSNRLSSGVNQVQGRTRNIGVAMLAVEQWGSNATLYTAMMLVFINSFLLLP